MPHSLHLHGLKFFLSNKCSGLPLLKAPPVGTGCPGKSERGAGGTHGQPHWDRLPWHPEHKIASCQMPTGQVPSPRLRAWAVQPPSRIQAAGLSGHCYLVPWSEPGQKDSGVSRFDGKGHRIPHPGWVLSELSLGFSSEKTQYSPELPSSGLSWGLALI